MTISEVINKISSNFKVVNVENPKLDSQLIVGNVLKMDRAMLLTYPEKEISDDEYEKIMEMAKKRMLREPIQYIIGQCEFMGLDFYVNENTLIPRNDTEVLVEKAIEVIKSEKYLNGLDIGTGSGAIAVSVAKYSKIQMTAIDISEKAIEVAKKNAERNEVKIDFILSNLFENVEGKFDIILSNPPYIETDVIETLEPEVRAYEPKTALDGGKDGLIFYREIVEKCSKYINKGGSIIFEIGYNQGKQVASLWEDNFDFEKVEVLKDLAGLDRVVIGYKLC